MTRHFIAINDFAREQLLQLLQEAQSFINDEIVEDRALLTGKAVANLFFEASTRTHVSFDLAAQKLNAHVINVNINNSSMSKGETVLDTVANLQAMGVEIFVVRHREQVMQQIAKILQPKVRLINAGEGASGHPTQAVLDLLTIRQCKKNFDNLRIAIVGDLKHSRVARSTIAGLQILGCKEIVLVGPKNLLPDDIANVTLETDMAMGLKNVDVVIMLRIQKERMVSGLIHNEHEYIEHYQLNTEKLAYAKKDAIVMHPGPINRGIEITDDVADGAQSVILQQVRNGVAVRMAILAGEL